MDSASGQSIGVSRGGRSIKIHAVADGLGNPLVPMLTGGEVHDSVMMQPALEHLTIKGSTVLADKAYGSKDNRAYITEKEADYCIPPRENVTEPWPCDYFHYKERHLVECFFMKIKDFRRIAMRFDKLARRYMTFVYLAAVLVWLA